MFNSIFKIIYFIELMIAIIIRKSYERKFIKLDVEIQKKSTIDLIFLVLNGIGMIVPIVYVFSSWLDFANYKSSRLARLGRSCVFCICHLVIMEVHHDLGRNWTPTVALRNEHKLIICVVYLNIFVIQCIRRI